MSSEHFFQGLSLREKLQARSTADVLVALLTRWGTHYPFVRPVRIPSVALLTATVAPHIPPADAMPSAQLSFWIFGVDDIADERTISPVELEKRAAYWYKIARGQDTDPVDKADGLAEMLIEIRTALSQLPLFQVLQPYWAAEVQGLVDAMIQEYHYGLDYTTRGEAALPDLDEYLGWGLHSIGVPLWSWAVWLGNRDPSIADYLEPIIQATEYCSAAVRLYNDLRSFEKEVQEQNVNAVLIACRQIRAGLPASSAPEALAHARSRILALADEYGARCREAVARIHTTTGQVEETLIRTVDFHAYFYARSQHDYNVTSLSDIYQLLSNHSN